MSVPSSLAAARAREVAWDDTRHTRVRAGVERVYVARKRRARAVSVVLSSLAGVALFALAIRAFGFSDPGNTTGSEARLPPPAAAYADGGFRSDATLRD
ncbi:hypothetical protein BH09MYX1_BH09MYX1_40740 [soil metagenome]